MPQRRNSERDRLGKTSGGVLLDEVLCEEFLDQRGCGIGGAKPGQSHDLPIGWHAPVGAIEDHNGGEIRAGNHEGLRIR